jgi:hypothetical protein
MLRCALVLAAALVAGCGGGAFLSDDGPVPFSSLAQTSFSGVGTQDVVVVRSAAEMAALWPRFAGPIVPLPVQPAVDFNAQQVVGVFLGSRPSGCYGVFISSITVTAGRLVVRWKEQTPSPVALCTAVITTPAHLVTLPRSELPVEFVAE